MGFKMPNIKIPQIKTPSIQMPEVKMPEIKTPDPSSMSSMSESDIEKMMTSNMDQFNISPSIPGLDKIEAFQNSEIGKKVTAFQNKTDEIKANIEEKLGVDRIKSKILNTIPIESMAKQAASKFIESAAYEKLSKELDLDSVVSEIKASIPDMNSILNDTMSMKDIPPEVRDQLNVSKQDLGFNDLTSGWSIL